MDLSNSLSLKQLVLVSVGGCTCSAPPGIKNGGPDGGPYNCNSDVFYRCSSGYSIVGSDRLRCESNGQWSGNPPSCQAEQVQPGDELNTVTKNLLKCNS